MKRFLMCIFWLSLLSGWIYHSCSVEKSFLETPTQKKTLSLKASCISRALKGKKRVFYRGKDVLLCKSYETTFFVEGMIDEWTFSCDEVNAFPNKILLLKGNIKIQQKDPDQKIIADYGILDLVTLQLQLWGQNCTVEEHGGVRKLLAKKIYVKLTDNPQIQLEGPIEVLVDNVELKNYVSS